MQELKVKLPSARIEGRALSNLARAYAWWRTRGPISSAITSERMQIQGREDQTRNSGKILGFFNVFFTNPAQEQLFTKINKPYIIGKVF